MKVIKGISILALILIFFILPLLSSADTAFAEAVASILEIVIEPIFEFIFDTSFFWRCAVCLVITVGAFVRGVRKLVYQKSKGFLIRWLPGS